MTPSPMLRHFLEIRRRIFHILGLFALLFLVFFFLAPNLFHQFMRPLLYVLPVESMLIATQLTTPFMTPMQLAADAALLCTAPFALFHGWCFVAPGLYRNERQQLRWVIMSSVVLFFMGIAFCFYLVLPMMLQFFVRAIPKDVHFMPDMASAADFMTRMLLTFGVSFQVPLLCMVFVRLQLLSITTLQQLRPYVIVAAFTIGMLLTPPDVLSQLMLAIPFCLLYESGLFLARFLAKQA